MCQYTIMREITAALLCLLLTVSASAFTSSELQTASEELLARGIMVGDETGAIRLNDPISRMELAVLLARLHGSTQVEDNREFYAAQCKFLDVPEWARQFAGYCAYHGLMAGRGGDLFGAEDPVTPADACTVILRICKHKSLEDQEWNYQTSVSYMRDLGSLKQGELIGPVTRGDIALLIYRVIDQGPHVDMESYNYWSREDFSQAANAAVFTEVYDRPLYDAIRQTMVDGTGPDAPGDQFAYTMVEDEHYSEVVQALGRLDGIVRYEHHIPTTLKNYHEYPDYFAVAAEQPAAYQDAIAFVQPVLREAGQLDTDREKAGFLNDYLRGLLTYERGATSGIPQTFSPHAGELPAACGSYARAFSFLCGGAGIPCFTIRSETHTWNMVYADGQWLHVDVSTNDSLVPNTILLTQEVTGPAHTDTDPDATEFLKELLVPGSTK